MMPSLGWGWKWILRIESKYCYICWSTVLVPTGIYLKPLPLNLSHSCLLMVEYLWKPHLSSHFWYFWPAVSRWESKQGLNSSLSLGFISITFCRNNKRATLRVFSRRGCLLLSPHLYHSRFILFQARLFWTAINTFDFHVAVQHV